MVTLFNFSFLITKKLLIIITLTLLSFSCSSGGGGGGSSGGGGGGGVDYSAACAYQGSSYSGCYPTRYSESSYETNEYNGDYGLGDINASAAYSRELTGADVKVGVFDSGIDTSHSEFTGKTISGWNYESGNSTLSDTNGHGTHVAGTIAARKDGSSTTNNMHGVAHGVSDLYIYKIFKDDALATSVSNFQSAVSDAASKAISAGVKVINHSYGTANRITDQTKSQWASSNSTQIAAYQNLVSNQIINVFPCVNS